MFGGPSRHEALIQSLEEVFLLAIVGFKGLRRRVCATLRPKLRTRYACGLVLAIREGENLEPWAIGLLAPRVPKGT